MGGQVGDVPDKPLLQTVRVGFEMELEREDGRPERERLMRESRCGRQQHRTVGNRELVTVPMQHRHVTQRCERIVRDVGERQRRVSDLETTGGFDRRTECGRDQLRRMLRLDSAVSEALRLASSSLTIRLVRRPIVLQLDSGGAWSLRQGDRVCLAPCVTHRDPELFPEPDRYRADRFLGAQFHKRGKKVGYALMPYGGGVSMCPGRFLAHEDIKHLVARVLHRLEQQLAAQA